MQDRLIYGCMRIAGDGSAESTVAGKDAVRAAIDSGYRWFDHADIYGDGRCESLFGELLQESPSLRDQLRIISKCGIRFAGDPNDDSPKRYDFSKGHTIGSVEGSLQRLKTDSLDLLLLHRPDYLLDANEVSDTFDELLRSGKVRAFGVSNFTPSQVTLLQHVCSMPLVAIQVEISLHNLSAFVNGTLDQCQQFDMTPQAWSPLRGITYSAIDDSFTQKIESRLRAELKRQAARYEIDDWAVALAWLLRHPAGISPVFGSLRPERIRAAQKALDVDYQREDWYRLLVARQGGEVP